MEKKRMVMLSWKKKNPSFGEEMGDGRMKKREEVFFF
jgi:hypothetical protein